MATHNDSRTLLGGGVMMLGVATAFLTLLLLLSHIIYNIFFHPLRHFPGPKSWAATRLQWHRHSMQGDLIYAIKALHDQYGPVVRVAPDELDYTTSTAWKTILGKNSPEMSKAFDGRGAPPPANGVPGLIHSPKENHARLRRAIFPAFSDRALRDQEGFVQQYVDLLISKLSGFADAGKPCDLTVWYNYTSFDIIGDLAYGESFHCLDNAEYHSLIHLVFGAVEVTLHELLRSYSLPLLCPPLIYYRLQGLMKYLAPKHLLKARQDTAQYSDDTMEKRLSADRDDRKDFVSYTVAKSDVSDGLGREEIRSMSNELIVAGSDTTSRLLAGSTHLVLTHPRVHSRLASEIRGAFATAKDINAVSVESLRMYPPSPSTLPRKVPGDGAEIDGQWVPGGTSVGINQWSASQSSANFHRANEFIPERWLDLAELPEHMAREAPPSSLETTKLPCSPSHMVPDHVSASTLRRWSTD
ncbi:Uu.00g074550.m01.CDS01 [Anthostomella pinea]|uniref:Uu.00g074550.m01.CDS01 n=1 Tax=Anthostomella pinea TaxID=933095 RepID=A0AAI8VW39_9PEZI|nr:Uu.00g074550.m01.CDS01 [Anthostomella pinea]